jgi:hypothetical protein
VAKNGSNIKYVVLDACHQGDRRFVFFGETNAQAVQRALDAELAARGKNPVTVMAAREGGPLYGNQHKPQIPKWDPQLGTYSRKPVDAIYVPAAQQPGRAYVDLRVVAALAGLGVVDVGAAVLLAKHLEQKRQEPPSAPAASRDPNAPSRAR